MSFFTTLNSNPRGTEPVNFRIPSSCNALCTFKSNFKHDTEKGEDYFITDFPAILQDKISPTLFTQRMQTLNREWHSEDSQASMAKLKRSGIYINLVSFLVILSAGPLAYVLQSSLTFLLALVGVFMLLVVNIGGEYIETSKEIAEDWTEEDAHEGRNLVYVVRTWRVGPLQSLLNVHVTVLERKVFVPVGDEEAQTAPTYAKGQADGTDA
ncbi:hypothetical protein BJ741DRAFT_619673 [Chytriomyces cf. hyalinus JEL632]|nr:hypothetical protein BJ741DRAFT_619673 [Chytriomyces cf. hyalinus JEL632]